MAFRNQAVNRLMLNLAIETSDPGLTLEETNGKFRRGHSEGTEKEHHVHSGKIFKIILKFNVIT